MTEPTAEQITKITAEVLNDQGPTDHETIGEAAQMYRNLRPVIERTMTEPDRWDGDEDEAFHLGRYVEWLAAELEQARVLAADATEYRVHLPDNGGTTLIARRQSLAHGTGWAVSTMALGPGRAWTTEGWQDSISALTVDRLFCWPDATTAITEARNALTTA